jgi:hypothetical protein
VALVDGPAALLENRPDRPTGQHESVFLRECRPYRFVELDDGKCPAHLRVILQAVEARNPAPLAGLDDVDAEAAEFLPDTFAVQYSCSLAASAGKRANIIPVPAQKSRAPTPDRPRMRTHPPGLGGGRVRDGTWRYTLIICGGSAARTPA